MKKKADKNKLLAAMIFYKKGSEESSFFRSDIPFPDVMLKDNRDYKDDVKNDIFEYEKDRILPVVDKKIQ